MARPSIPRTCRTEPGPTVAPRRQPRESFSGSVNGGARKPVAIAPSRPSKPASGEKLRTKV